MVYFPWRSHNQSLWLRQGSEYVSTRHCLCLYSCFISKHRSEILDSNKPWCPYVSDSIDIFFWSLYLTVKSTLNYIQQMIHPDPNHFIFDLKVRLSNLHVSGPPVFLTTKTTECVQNHRDLDWNICIFSIRNSPYRFKLKCMYLFPFETLHPVHVYYQLKYIIQF